MPVLLIIDMLNSFLARWEPEQKGELICATNRLAQHFRSRAWPVIWIRQDFKPDLSDAFLEMRDKNISINLIGSDESRIAIGLDVAASDAVIVKKRYSAFFGTDLDAVLDRLEATELVLAGINTHACVRMTAIDAYQRDIRVVLAREAVSSYDEEHERISLRYMHGKIARVMTIAEIIDAGHGPIWSA